MIQESNDPLFAWLIMLPGDEKNQKNNLHLSYTIGNIHPELCTQFQLAFSYMQKFETYGHKMSFL